MPQTATAHQCHTLPLYTKATHCHCTPWSHTTTTQKGHTQPLHPRVHITHTYHHHPLPCTMQHHCTQLKYTSHKAGVIKEDIDDIIVITDIIAKYGCYKWYNWYLRYKRYNWYNRLSTVELCIRYFSNFNLPLFAQAIQLAAFKSEISLPIK